MNADLFGEIRDLAQGVDAGGAGFRWQQADGGRALGEVPLQRAGAYHFDGGGGELILRQQIAILRGEGGREAADVLVQRQEAGGEAQLAHGVEMLFGVAEGTDDPAERVGLERRGCGRGEGRGWFERVGENGGGGQAGEMSSIHHRSL